MRPSILAEVCLRCWRYRKNRVERPTDHEVQYGSNPPGSMPLEMIDRPGRQSPSTVLTKRVTKAIRVMALPDVPSTRQQSGEP